VSAFSRNGCPHSPECAVSCKYLSRNLHNRSPSRVFDRLLGPGDTDTNDWYLRSAPGPYQALYEAAAAFAGRRSGVAAATGDGGRDAQRQC